MTEIVKPAVADRIASLIRLFGQPGSRIAGSRYVRWYCSSCGEPIRVGRNPWPPPVRDCERCSGRHGQIASPVSGPRDDTSGYQANAIRAMEGD